MKNHAKFLKALKKLMLKNPRVARFSVMDLTNDAMTITVNAAEDRNVVRELKNLFTGEIESKLAWIITMKGTVFIRATERYLKVLIKDTNNVELVNHEERYECEENA